MMADECYVVLDSQGRRLAGPLSERAARIWATFSSTRLPRPFAVACVGTPWNPLATFGSTAEVPGDVWALQRIGELIVVATADGKLAVFV